MPDNTNSGPVGPLNPAHGGKTKGGGGSSPLSPMLATPLTLGIEWHSVLNHFRLSVANHSSHYTHMKQALVSDTAKTNNVLGWFAPVIIKEIIILQSVWESKVEWDEEVP